MPAPVSNQSNSAAAAEAARAEAARRAEEARRAAEAAAEAARKAAEAQKAAEEAQKAAQAARQARDAAKNELSSAREDASKAKSQVKSVEQQLGQASPQHVQSLQKNLDQAKASSADADKKVDGAANKVQAAEEQVATASKAAEDAMRKANEAAGKEGVAAPYSEQKIRQTGVQANEVRDAFDGAEGRRRDDLAQKLGFKPTTDTNAISQQLEGDRQYARLYQDPGAKQELDAQGIKNGSDLRAFGQRVDRLATEGGPSRVDDKPLKTNDPASLDKILQGAGQALDGTAKQRLTDPTFTKLVAEGNDPKKVAAGGPELAKMVYGSLIQNAAGKPTSQWTTAEADKFTNALAYQMEAHKSDPNFQRALMTNSGAELQRTAELVGKATNENGNRDQTEAMMRGLARIGNAAPEDARARLAMGVASKISNDSELHYVDDGLDHFKKNGGNDTFQKTLDAALQTQKKGDAADELMNRNKGFFDKALNTLGDIGGGALDALKDIGGGIASGAKGAWDFTVDASKTVVDTGIDIAHTGANLAIDGANAVQQAAGDAIRAPLELGLKGVDLALKGAQALAPDELDGLLQKGRDLDHLAQQGVEATDKLQEKLGEVEKTLAKAGTGLAAGAAKGLNDLRADFQKDPVKAAKALKDGIEATVNALQVEDRIKGLGKGDSFQMQAGLDASVLGLDANLQGTMNVTKGDDGKYTLAVDGQIGAGVAEKIGTQGAGAGAKAQANITAGAKVEFKFDSAEDAAKAARTFMGPAVGAISGIVDSDSITDVPGNAVEGATPQLKLLADHASAVELHGGAVAELGGKLGIKGVDGLDVSAKADANLAARIEFNRGSSKPPQLVFQESAGVSVNGSVGGEGANASASGSGRVTLEQRFDLKDVSVGDLIKDPLGTAGRFASNGTASVTLSGSGGVNASLGAGDPKNGKGGASAGEQINASVTVSGKIGDVAGIMGKAITGDFNGALNAADHKLTVSGGVSTSRTSGLNAEIGAGDGAGDSFDVKFSALTTDVNQLARFDNVSVEQARQTIANLLRQNGSSVPLFG